MFQNLFIILYQTFQLFHHVHNFYLFSFLIHSITYVAYPWNARYAKHFKRLKNGNFKKFVKTGYFKTTGVKSIWQICNLCDNRLQPVIFSIGIKCNLIPLMLHTCQYVFITIVFNHWKSGNFDFFIKFTISKPLVRGLVQVYAT